MHEISLQLYILQFPVVLQLINVSSVIRMST